MYSAAAARLGGTIRRSLIAFGLVAVFAAGTALAAGANRIRLGAPRDARSGVGYTVSVSGHAAKEERLYLFVDYHACGRNPAIETVHGGVYGVHWIVKRGKFHERLRVTSTGVGTDHLCAYLQKRSEPLNAPGGILARAHLSYRIH
jgi:hypothetical protein